MDLHTELRAMAARGATGRLDVSGARGSGQVWFATGRVSHVALSTARPALGMRLVSGGNLSLTNLGAALATQQQYPTMRLGDVLVRMGLVDRQAIEAVAWEQMCDDVLAMLDWQDPVTQFTALRPDEAPSGGHDVEELLAAAASRAATLQRAMSEVGGPDTVPVLTDASLHHNDSTLRPVEWAVLCRVDGRRSLRQIAEQAGFTTLEAVSVLKALLAAGLVTVPTSHLQPPQQPVALPPQQSATHVASSIYDDPAELLRELSQLGGLEQSPRRRSAR